MYNKLKYKSDAFAAIHQDAIGLYSLGLMPHDAILTLNSSCLIDDDVEIIVLTVPRKSINMLTTRVEQQENIKVLDPKEFMQATLQFDVDNCEPYIDYVLAGGLEHSLSDIYDGMYESAEDK